jgi:hypothetical protein
MDRVLLVTLGPIGSVMILLFALTQALLNVSARLAGSR